MADELADVPSGVALAVLKGLVDANGRLRGGVGEMLSTSSSGTGDARRRGVFSAE